MFKMILLIASLSFGCAKLIYTNGNELAVQQESLFVNYKRGIDPSPDTLRDLKINWWVRTSERVAPSNLIIRQFCLIDLFDKAPNHAKRIQVMMDLLSGGNGPLRTFAESYTYWNYVKEILYYYLKVFPNDTLRTISYEIENGFATTAYRRSGIYYPAPFGDLWDQPLDSIGQDLATDLCRPSETVGVHNITRYQMYGNVNYSISPMPMGMNGHCDKVGHSHEINIDVPSGFKYYEGYSKKYKDAKAEWYDLLSPVRIISILFIK